MTLKLKLIKVTPGENVYDFVAEPVVVKGMKI